MVRRLLVAGAIACVAALAMALPAGAATRPTTWVCLPSDTPNPCHDSLETTVQGATPADSTVVDPPFAKHPKVDCFYVYPTVNDQPGPNADGTVGPQERSISSYQASRFSRRCDVYAPAYRQLTLPSLLAGTQTDQAAITAYHDVRHAFRDYLQHYNKGRPFVLIGHSQGSFMLRALIRDTVDKRKNLRKRMLSAMLMGGNVAVKKGSDHGGDFENVRACHSATQLHCVIAYSTFDERPPADTKFGSVSGRFADSLGFPSGKKYHVLCTNPAALGGGKGRLRTLARTEPFQGVIEGGVLILYGGVPPAAATPWVQPTGYYEAGCRNYDGTHVLMVTPRDGAQDLTPSPDATWGLHLADVNLAQGQLVGLVQHEAKAYARRNR